MYQVLLYTHILAAIVWVGGAFFAQLLTIRIGRASPADLPSIGRTLSFLGMRVFLPASIILFLAGAAMVAQAWSFGDLWIAVSMALWLASALVGALFIGPSTKKIAEFYDTEGPTSEAARALTARVFLVSRLELVSFAVIIALMVFKPGASGGA